MQRIMNIGNFKIYDYIRVAICSFCAVNEDACGFARSRRLGELRRALGFSSFSDFVFGDFYA